MYEDKNLTEINNNTITKLLDRYGYIFYVIKRVPNIKCTCVSPLSKEADSNCKKCLGTGSKIKIHKVYGISREIKNTETLRSAESATVTPKVYYIKGYININKDDIVVDSENIFKVFSYQYHRGEHGACIFTRLTCPTQKIDKPKLIKNFKELLNEYNIRNK